MISQVVGLDAGGAAAALENGDVLFLQKRGFAVHTDEMAFFTPAILAAGKNVSFDPMTGRIHGTSLVGDAAARLVRMLSRFSDESSKLIPELCPEYCEKLQRARTSFRPAEIAGRASSWRKDDTRLHVDSFPATPVQGRRILRVFSNVNPDGRPRSWRIGDDFESVARRFGAVLRLPLPGSAILLRLLRVTKTARSPYDALMLQLHDRMKADADYQACAPQTPFAFPAGTTWIAFTDQVSHAAMTGQYQLEQTFLLPVDAMLDGERSPLRVLERLKERVLV